MVALLYGTGNYVQIFSNTGTKVGSAISPFLYISGMHTTNPFVLGLNNGNFVVVCDRQLNSQSGYYSNVGQIFDANGTILIIQ